MFERSCRTCAFRVTNVGRFESRCRAQVTPKTGHINPLDGRYVRPSYGFAPTITEARTLNGFCGPAADRWRLKWWRRILRKVIMPQEV
jgi:hypothetical protein